MKSKKDVDRTRAGMIYVTSRTCAFIRPRGVLHDNARYVGGDVLPPRACLMFVDCRAPRGDNRTAGESMAGSTPPGPWWLPTCRGRCRSLSQATSAAQPVKHCQQTSSPPNSRRAVRLRGGTVKIGSGI